MSDEDRTPPVPFTTDITPQRGDVVFATDKRGRLVYWNKESETLFGYAPSEVLGNPFDVICLAAPGGSEIYLPAIMAGRDFAGGVHCLSKPGREIELYVYATAGRNQAGTVAGVVFVARDVSEFWRAEQAVRTAEDKYRLLFEHSSDSVAIADVEGRVLEANPACLRLYGYTAEEIRHMNLVDVVAPEHRAEAAEVMADLAAGRTVTKTINMLRKDGTRLAVDLAASVISVQGKQRILSVTRDVTERVNAEAVLRESEERYRTIFASVGDAVFLETPDGSILEVNDNACRLLGYTRDELLARKVSDLVPPDARAWLPRVTDAVLRDRTFRAEAVNVHKSGRQIPVEISLSVMELKDRTLLLAIARDISERKDAQAALAESENRYRTLFDDSLIGIYRTTPSGQIQLANPALVRMLGYESFAQLAERNLETDDSGPEYKRDEFKRRLERDGRIVGLEVRWQTRDGRALFVRENARAVRGPDGAVLYYEGTVEDITERRLAEQALRESEERYRQIVESGAIGVVTADPSFRFTAVNSRFCEMLGYTEEELKKRAVVDVTHPEDAGKDRAAVAEVFAGKRSYYTTVKRYIRRDGGEVLARTTVFPVSDYAGQTRYTLATVEDITERSRAEAALAASEARYRTLFDNMRDGVYLLDREGRFTFVNDVIVNRSGRPREWWLGRDHIATVQPEDRGRVRQAYEAAMRGEPAAPYEAAYPTATGKLLFIEMNAAPIREGDEVVGVVGVSRDMTERKAAEQALRESEERFRNLVESSPDGIAVYQGEKVVIANEACARLLGYDSPDALIGRRTGEFVNPDDMTTVTEREKMLQGRPVGQAEGPLRVRFRRRDGSLVHTEVVGATTTWNGAPAIQVMIRDVAVRKAVEKRMQESEEQYRRLVEMSPDGVAVHQNGRLVLVNPAGARMLGYERPEELVGKPVLDLVHTADQPAVLARIKQVMQLGKPGELVEERFRRKDGTYVPVEVVNAPFYWKGKPAVQVVVRDISGRRELARAAEAAEAQMQAVLANSPDGIAAECDGVIAYANQRFAELYGYDSPVQVTGRQVTDFLAPEDEERVAEYTKARMRGDPAPARYRFKGIRRDSTLVEVEITVSTYVLLGKQYLLGFLREAAARPKRLFSR